MVEAGPMPRSRMSPSLFAGSHAKGFILRRLSRCAPGAADASARLIGRRQGGFSLVEAAVVLVVIGLILAAVLQGRELIASAEYKSFRSQLSEYRSAFQTFRDRYNALPGDFGAADARLGLSGANGDGDGVIDGDANCTSAGEESCRTWQHLRAAGMLDGDPGKAGRDASPNHPYGGLVDAVFTGTAGNADFGHHLSIEDLPVAIARRLDAEADDGNCNDGRVSGQNCASTSSEWPTAARTVDVIYAL
jgi:type II secretory pathway pseudopilin PulG